MQEKDLFKIIKNNENFCIRSLQDITPDIVRLIQDGSAVLFCGAGISFNSGLPLVKGFIDDKGVIKEKGFIDTVLNKLNADTDEIKRIHNATLPFESFMGILQENSSIDILLDIFDKGEPNSNHRLIANLMVSGKINIIVTTNFDKLIEKALIEENWNENVNYDLYYREEDYLKINREDGRPKLIKIHGSIHDKEGMAITMQRIAGQMHYEPRKAVIDYVFGSGSHNNVLILGYSSSDSFDLSPYIEAIEREHRKVVLVEHEKNNTDTVRIEDIRVKSENNNPFKNFKNSFRLYCNTDSLVEQIWKAIGTSNKNKSNMSNKFWEQHIDRWLSNLHSEAAKHLIIGRILMDIDKKVAAAKHFDLAVIASQTASDKKRESFSYSLLGDIKGSIPHLEHALNISRAINDKKQEANCLCSLAMLYFFENKIERAIKCCEYGLDITTRSVVDKQREGRLLGNLGSIYGSLGKFEKALVYFEKATSVSREIGDKAEEGGSLFNIGFIVENMGRYRKAKRHYEQSLHSLRPFLGDEHDVVKKIKHHLVGLGCIVPMLFVVLSLLFII